MPAIHDNAHSAWELYAEELSKFPGVIYVSTGFRTRDGKQTKEPVVTVTVTRKVTPDRLSVSTKIPGELPLPNGEIVGTDVLEDPAGYPTIDQDTASYRPVPGGCEIGPNGSGFLGTLGGWFCTPSPGDPSGWNPVWLTNAHVADPANRSVIPADSRMTQPWGGAVIGNTTGISGWPNPPPGPGVTVPGVTDAAIGILNDDVDPDFQVLNIAPAPFEIGTASSGLGVQKRGRTTRLTNGSVVAPGFTTANMTSTAGGIVTWGLPGQPRVFRITSLATGLAAAFGAPGDSGSLVFAQAAGQLSSTFPCVGLYFAGTFRWVSNQPNPNALTVTGLAFDITGVMAQFQLNTVCSCIVRSLLASIFGSDSSTESASADSTQQRVRSSEKMMRSFRDGVLAKSSTGKIIANAVAQTAPNVSRVLVQDPTAFGLAVEMLEPWAKASTSLWVLQRKLDERTIRMAEKLGKRVIQLCPETSKEIEPMIKLVHKWEGKPVRKLIGSFRTQKLPKVDRIKRTKKRK